MPRTLLLADDSVTIQKVVGISFANEDVRLVTVDNGDDALARVREEQPDLVLADVVMPGRSGYEVCEAIKSDPDLRHIPVLLLSGTFEAFDDDRAQRAGADGHITKPFEAQTLVDRVNQLLTAAATAAPAPAQASEETSFDFFEEEVGAADAGETTVVASDDLEFGAGDEAFMFDPSDPMPEPETSGPGLRGVASVESWSADSDLDGGPEDGLDALGLEAPTDAALGSDDPDPVLEPPEEETSPGDAGRALGLDAPVGAVPSPGAAGTQVAAREFDVSSSDLGDLGAEPADPSSARPGPDGLRAELVDALEKIAWEAFGDLTEQLVKQTVAKVEAIAWEVIPEMAERLVREEIEKLKE